MVEIPEHELEALHRRQNDAVLVMTVHIQLHPTRLSFLGADGELRVFDGTTGKRNPPPPMRILPAGMDTAGMMGERP